MILSAHQPNFIPYGGYFYKIFVSDLFAISDLCKYSSTEYQNYNYIWDNKKKGKITLPVSSLPAQSINDKILSKNIAEDIKKIDSRIYYTYHRQKYFEDVYSILKPLLYSGDSFLGDYNTRIIRAICNYMKISTPIIRESEILNPEGSATEQIVKLCKKLHADSYLTGEGGKKYLDTELFGKNGINLLWSRYKEIESGELKNLSIIDYLMKNGPKIPEYWYNDKEYYHELHV